MSINKMLKLAEKLEKRAQGVSVMQTGLESVFSPMKADLQKTVENWVLKSLKKSCVGAVNAAWVPARTGGKLVCGGFQLVFGDHRSDSGSVLAKSTLNPQEMKSINAVLAAKAGTAKALLERALNAGGAFENLYKKSQPDGSVKEVLGKPDGVSILPINLILD